MRPMRKLDKSCSKKLRQSVNRDPAQSDDDSQPSAQLDQHEQNTGDDIHKGDREIEFPVWIMIPSSWERLGAVVSHLIKTYQNASRKDAQNDEDGADDFGTSSM